jgi:hypothetical protein
MTLHPLNRERYLGRKAPIVQRTPSSAAALTTTQSANLFTVGQTVGQPTRTVADIGDPGPAPGATLGRVCRQRFCPDTEEVTGSNPVSPTSITPGQGQIPGSQTVPGAGPETVAYLTAYLSPRLLMREECVHRARTAGEHRPQLLAVHQLGDAAAGVANQVGDVLDTHPGAR